MCSILVCSLKISSIETADKDGKIVESAVCGVCRLCFMIKFSTGLVKKLKSDCHLITESVCKPACFYKWWETHDGNSKIYIYSHAMYLCSIIIILCIITQNVKMQEIQRFFFLKVNAMKFYSAKIYLEGNTTYHLQWTWLK